MKNEDVVQVLNALHKAAMHYGEPGEVGDLQEYEQRRDAYGPKMWQESISLWQCVLKVTETRPDDPEFAPAWDALVSQARFFNSAMEHQHVEGKVPHERLKKLRPENA